MSVSLRKARAEDEALVLAVENEPRGGDAAVRKTPISEREHAAWFAERLEDPDCAIFLIQAGARPAGVLRLARARGEVVFSIGVLGLFRGCGLGSEAIRLGLEEARAIWGEARAVAFVAEANAASLRAFERAGFGRWGEGESGWIELRNPAPPGGPP